MRVDIFKRTVHDPNMVPGADTMFHVKNVAATDAFQENFTQLFDLACCEFDACVIVPQPDIGRLVFIFQVVLMIRGTPEPSEAKVHVLYIFSRTSTNSKKAFREAAHILTTQPTRTKTWMRTLKKKHLSVANTF